REPGEPRQRYGERQARYLPRGRGKVVLRGPIGIDYCRLESIGIEKSRNRESERKSPKDNEQELQ
ncbi:MAG: hypothetical protein MJZ54_04895, partial [Bacteroidaceae bacterium]|nr:hypothetical protein [Bacteroidaceae bacterium]